MACVLIGVDASDASRRAVDFAAQRALTLENQLVIAHVIPWSPFSFNTPNENEERHRRKLAEVKAATEQIVAPLVEAARKEGVEAKGVVRHGQPAETLLDILKEEQGIHIVVGRTGDSVLKQTIFGSIANRLAQAAPVPVTVVP